jgi:hypothetical protein
MILNKAGKAERIVRAYRELDGVHPIVRYRTEHIGTYTRSWEELEATRRELLRRLEEAG